MFVSVDTAAILRDEVAALREQLDRKTTECTELKCEINVLQQEVVDQSIEIKNLNLKICSLESTHNDTVLLLNDEMCTLRREKLDQEVSKHDLKMKLVDERKKNAQTKICLHMQYTQLTSLITAIVALRKLDACEAPWLFTQYCYLDFHKKWEMANSAKRQQRCFNMTTNAAVFLEATLRNIDWDTFTHCWGDAFDIGFGNGLRQSTLGINFLQNLRSKLSVANELNYTLQWQNYKYIGAINTYTITNAYGVSYPFTISATKGAYRWSDESSLKMYWSFGNDLKSIVGNSTLMGGKSLLRSSGQFALANASLYMVYVKSTSLIKSPTDPIYTTEQSFLGPFGSIDMIYVGVPHEVQEVLRYFLHFAQQVRQQEPDLYNNITTFNYPTPVLQTWLEDNVSDSSLCPISGFNSLSDLSFNFDTVCDPILHRPNSIEISKVHNMLFATIFANLNDTVDLDDACSEVLSVFDNCQLALNSTLDLLNKYSTRELYGIWATQLYESVRNLNIQWMQLGHYSFTSPIYVYHEPVLSNFNNSDILAWHALYDWMIGVREVVSFQGDNGNITLLGNTMNTYAQPVDVSQLPTVFALFAQRGVQYVTYVIIALASITSAYISFSRGHVEGMNLFKVSSVGGIIWIGRPLILVRSLTALCLLSTANVVLEMKNGMSYFTTISEQWYTTCLAANEVTWLVGIVNDLFIVYTNEWTHKYAFINSIIVWVTSACLATLVPVQPTITIDSKCQVDTLDFQVRCNLGDVAIGSLFRLLLLCGIVIASNCLCYIATRRLLKKPNKAISSSFLLCGSARYLFKQDKWKCSGVFYLDTASAVVNGLISFRHRGTWYVFDVKTWRLHKIEQTLINMMQIEFKRVIPLVDNNSKDLQ
ncbi:hypothetical protein THRCLA_21061 [Thraustotheca clavata]|uniref:Uncharacterized protein n=1 Tax=Thraustotheca clavata TaxID=74557 RepID=A0A1W0A0J4_9STRA|nr:hypothetical protein THRCLA_21061 [Thraustotheca clavata]